MARRKLIRAKTRHWTDVGLMLSQRRRRWDNIKLTLGQCLVIASISLTWNIWSFAESTHQKWNVEPMLIQVGLDGGPKLYQHQLTFSNLVSVTRWPTVEPLLDQRFLWWSVIIFPSCATHHVRKYNDYYFLFWDIINRDWLKGLTAILVLYFVSSSVSCRSWFNFFQNFHTKKIICINIDKNPEKTPTNYVCT